MWRDGDCRCVFSAALGGEFDVPAVFSRWTQLESTSIANLTKMLRNTNLYRASGRTKGVLILCWDTKSKESIPLNHIQDTAGVEAPFYCE